MNTVQHYLEQIDDAEVRAKALGYADPYDTLWLPVESVSAAISAAFIWTDTPEGFHYWRDIHNNLSNPQNH